MGSKLFLAIALLCWCHDGLLAQSQSPFGSHDLPKVSSSNIKTKGYSFEEPKKSTSPVLKTPLHEVLESAWIGPMPSKVRIYFRQYLKNGISLESSDKKFETKLKIYDIDLNRRKIEFEPSLGYRLHLNEDGKTFTKVYAGNPQEHWVISLDQLSLKSQQDVRNFYKKCKRLLPVRKEYNEAYRKYGLDEKERLSDRAWRKNYEKFREDIYNRIENKNFSLRLVRAASDNKTRPASSTTRRSEATQSTRETRSVFSNKQKSNDAAKNPPTRRVVANTKKSPLHLALNSKEMARYAPASVQDLIYQSKRILKKTYPLSLTHPKTKKHVRIQSRIYDTMGEFNFSVRNIPGFDTKKASDSTQWVSCVWLAKGSKDQVKPKLQTLYQLAKTHEIFEDLLDEIAPENNIKRYQAIFAERLKNAPLKFQNLSKESITVTILEYKDEQGKVIKGKFSSIKVPAGRAVNMKTAGSDKDLQTSYIRFKVKTSSGKTLTFRDRYKPNFPPTLLGKKMGYWVRITKRSLNQ